METSDSSEREERTRHGKEKRRKSYDREQTKFNVDSQKALIVDLLKRGKFAQARRVIDEVVDYNLEHGGAEYACKTLCSLALGGVANEPTAGSRLRPCRSISRRGAKTRKN